jgi:cysteine desulfurase
VEAYLDNLATTPLDPRVLAVMLPLLSGRPGNPHARVHSWGRAASEAVDAARATVAGAMGVGVKADEVVFTPSATAANNLALFGIAGARVKKGNHILVSAIEHPSVLGPAAALALQGFDVEVMPVGADGILDPETVRARLRPETILVSVMAVNNEVGTIQPVAAIRALLSRSGPVLHVDASQAPGKIALAPLAEAADLLTLSGHKAYGPMGAAALVVRDRRSIRPRPVLIGGGQENGMWPGTLNVPAVVGLGEALRLCEAERESDVARIALLSQALLAAIQEAFPGSARNGDPSRAVPHCLSVTVDGVAGETLVALLAREGVGAALGSACATEAAKPSHVLAALGIDSSRTRRTLRFGLGRFTTAEEIAFTGDVLRVFAARLARV